MNNIFSGEEYGVNKTYFAGREDFLRKLRKIITDGSLIIDWRIIGKMGYGKTSLAKVFKSIITDEFSTKNILYLNIDFRKIKKPDLLFSTSGNPTSLFYQSLLDKIYHELKSKNLKCQFYYNSKRIISQIKSIKIPFIGTTREIDLSPQITSSYLNELNTILRLNKTVIDSLIITFDDLNSLKDDVALKACSNYCRSLKESADIFIEKDFNIKNITTIVLAPFYRSERELKQRFNFDFEDILPELDKLAIENYLQKRLDINCFENLQAIANSIFFYTGGIPKAFQFLGLDAYGNYLRDAEKTKKKFSENYIKAAFSNGKAIGQIRRDIISGLKETIFIILENSIDQTIIKNISELTTLQNENTGLRWLEKDEWATLIYKNIPEDIASKNISFNKIWNYLLGQEVIKKEGYKYRFTSEMHRKAINKAV